MENAKPTKTPCCPCIRLLPHEGTTLYNPIDYRRMVGALQYLTFTRLDLAFSVHQLCQFMHHPTTTHFEAAKRVLDYVKGTLNHGIHFSPSPLTLLAFANAYWAGDPTYHRSTTRFIVFFGSNLVSWSSKK